MLARNPLICATLPTNVVFGNAAGFAFGSQLGGLQARVDQVEFQDRLRIRIVEHQAVFRDYLNFNRLAGTLKVFAQSLYGFFRQPFRTCTNRGLDDTPTDLTVENRAEKLRSKPRLWQSPLLAHSTHRQNLYRVFRQRSSSNQASPRRYDQSGFWYPGACHRKIPYWPRRSFLRNRQEHQVVASIGGHVEVGRLRFPRLCREPWD